MLLNEILKNLKLPYSISEKEFCQYRKIAIVESPDAGKSLKGLPKY